MSYGCGTLATPNQPHAKGIDKAARGNGKQHTLPVKASHKKIDMDTIEDLWSYKPPSATLGPSRLWGTIKESPLGGEIRKDAEPEMWTSGDYWNVDSNIRKWGEHEVKRNASSGAHDVHRHDQIRRLALQPHPSEKNPKPMKNCVSGVISPDCCFLEAWGFDLGQRDRQGVMIMTPFKPCSKGEMFRSSRSFQRDLPRLTESFRSLRRTISLPGYTHPEGAVTLKPEDVGGEANYFEKTADTDLEDLGKTHGSRSCRYWDAYGHTTKREGARLSHTIHGPAFREHREGYPAGNLELRPGLIYTRRFQQGGESSFTKHHGRLRGNRGR